jgi:hypothetical protein
MNINLLYMYQMVSKTAERLEAELGGQKERAVSKAFVFLEAKNLLDLDADDEVVDCIYNGRGDFGIEIHRNLLADRPSSARQAGRA